LLQDSVDAVHVVGADLDREILRGIDDAAGRQGQGQAR
jgi:hypothetical protein